MNFDEFRTRVESLPDDVKSAFIKKHNVRVFTENKKLCDPVTGAHVVGSISLAAGLTCPGGVAGVGCKGCYAFNNKMGIHNRVNTDDILKSGAYVLNTIHYLIDSADYWQKLEKDLLKWNYRFVRICDTGDVGFLGGKFYSELIEFTENHKYVKFYGFTQFHQFSTVTENCIIRKSMFNRSKGTPGKHSYVVMPGSTVYGEIVPKDFKTVENRAAIDYINSKIIEKKSYICSGSCAECAQTGQGCYDYNIDDIILIYHR